MGGALRPLGAAGDDSRLGEPSISTSGITKGQECNTGVGGSATRTWGASHRDQIATQGAGGSNLVAKRAR